MVHGGTLAILTRITFEFVEAKPFVALETAKAARTTDRHTRPRLDADLGPLLPPRRRLPLAGAHVHSDERFADLCGKFHA